MRNSLRELPSDQLTTCAFFRIWCVVELVAALLADIPVLMLVGAEQRAKTVDTNTGGEAAPGFLVQGAGSQEANGTYFRDGEYSGAPLYKKDPWWLLRYTLPSGNRFWYIADKNRLDVDAGDLYRVRSDGDQPPLAGWGTACAGCFPPPTLARLEEEEEREAGVEEGEGGLQVEDTNKRNGAAVLGEAKAEEFGEGEAEGIPLGLFEPTTAMLETLLECVDVGKAIASVSAEPCQLMGQGGRVLRKGGRESG
jgi:hypothetical protein